MFKRHFDNRIPHFKFKTLLHPQQICTLILPPVGAGFRNLYRCLELEVGICRRQRVATGCGRLSWKGRLRAAFSCALQLSLIE